MSFVVLLVVCVFSVIMTRARRINERNILEDAKKKIDIVTSAGRQSMCMSPIVEYADDDMGFGVSNFGDHHNAFHAGAQRFQRHRKTTRFQRAPRPPPRPSQNILPPIALEEADDDEPIRRSPPAKTDEDSTYMSPSHKNSPEEVPETTTCALNAKAIAAHNTEQKTRLVPTKNTRWSIDVGIDGVEPDDFDSDNYDADGRLGLASVAENGDGMRTARQSPQSERPVKTKRKYDVYP